MADMTFEQDQCRHILAWLREAPFFDRRKQAANPSFSYDEWFARGKTLSRGQDCLVGLLDAEVLTNVDSDALPAAVALGQIGDRSAVVSDALVRLLAARDPMARMAAAASLGTQGDARSVVALEALLVDPAEDSNVRANAALSLAELAPAGAADVLRKASHDTDPIVKSGAERALAKLGGRR